MQKKNIFELTRMDNATFKEVKKIPLVVILDNIRSLHNVGSVFRTSDAFLIETIYLCGITSTPPHPEIHKTALGAEDSVEWFYQEDTCKTVEGLKNKGYMVLGIEQVKGSMSLEKFVTEENKKYAVILGNEVKGVQQSVVDLCDGVLEIPQCGTKHSLNVSVTGGIVLWHFFNQLKNKI